MTLKDPVDIAVLRILQSTIEGMISAFELSPETRKVLRAVVNQISDERLRRQGFIR